MQKSKKKHRSKRKNISPQKIKLVLIILVVIIVSISQAWHVHKIKYSKTISSDGLTLLNDYEFPWYLVEDDSCISPYDVGDGVITFGPGITFLTEQDGIDTINELYNSSYTLDDDCIALDTLFDYQTQILVNYEQVINQIAIRNFRQFTQDQFNGLVILSYNSPNLFKNEQFLEVILDENSTYDQYVEAANNYYKQLDNYDTYGAGWYNRIVDSAEVYYNSEYEYQNNAIS